jgi:hypothetical protein
MGSSNNCNFKDCNFHFGNNNYHSSKSSSSSSESPLGALIAGSAIILILASATCPGFVATSLAATTKAVAASPIITGTINTIKCLLVTSGGFKCLSIGFNACLNAAEKRKYQSSESHYEDYKQYTYNDDIKHRAKEGYVYIPELSGKVYNEENGEVQIFRTYQESLKDKLIVAKHYAAMNIKSSDEANPCIEYAFASYNKDIDKYEITGKTFFLKEYPNINFEKITDEELIKLPTPYLNLPTL